MSQKTSIEEARAIEILDSRGNPTLRAYVKLESGIIGSANVPSGASTAENEAVELRDGDRLRYGGKGVLKAVSHVTEVISPRIRGMDVCDQAALDRALMELDGTEHLSRLGANAVLGVSTAAARAAAAAVGRPLYEYLGDGNQPRRLPMPLMNVINGGKHSPNNLAFQEFMIVPLGADTFSEAVQLGVETYHSLAGILRDKKLLSGVGDEGGFAPQLASNAEACELLVAAIQAAGYRPGEDVAIAIDPAPNTFYSPAGYDLSATGEGVLSSAQLLKIYLAWIEKYPLVSIEDGFAETDWEGFRRLNTAVGDRIQLIGDDLYATNPTLIRKGIQLDATNAVLIKLNQIGTVTQTVEAIQLCREVGWNYIISHRSGETDDSFIADFSVAMGGGQIKTGAPCRGERVAKYNRLLEIEAESGARVDFHNPFARRDA